MACNCVVRDFAIELPRRLDVGVCLLWNVVSGEIVTVTPKKHWIYYGHPYLSADIVDSRFELSALDLTPLQLNPFGMWDPARHYWGEEGESEQDWEKEIKAAGPRPQHEMEKIVPGEDPQDFDSDPIVAAAELKDTGDAVAARQVLSKRPGKHPVGVLPVG